MAAVEASGALIDGHGLGTIEHRLDIEARKKDIMSHVLLYFFKVWYAYTSQACVHVHMCEQECT